MSWDREGVCLDSAREAGQVKAGLPAGEDWVKAQGPDTTQNCDRL